MRNTLTLALAAVLTTSFSCSDDSAKTQVADTVPAVLKVSVLADGAILLDGAKTSLLTLRERLGEVAGSNAVVWYYRAESETEPPGEALLAFQAIIDNQLPISLSTEPDFSTVVASDGTAKPR